MAFRALNGPCIFNRAENMLYASPPMAGPRRGVTESINRMVKRGPLALSLKAGTVRNLLQDTTYDSIRISESHGTTKS